MRALLSWQGLLLLVAASSLILQPLVVAQETFTITYVKTVESTSLTMRIQRSNKVGPLTATVSLTAQDGNTASADTDFPTTPLTGNFADGEKYAWVVIPINDDDEIEEDETFTVTVTGPGYTPSVAEITIQDDDDPVHFDCNRHGTECMNSGTCSVRNPDCDCEDTHQGYNCAIETGYIDVMSICGDCSGNGECVAGSCVCSNPEYYSGADDKCELPRIAVTSCEDEKMTVVINPEVADVTVPLMRVAGSTDDACKLSTAQLDTDKTNGRVPADEGYAGQSQTVDFDGACGTHEPEVSDDDPDVSCYKIPFTINYKPNFVTRNDQLVLATCCLNTNGNVTTQTTVNVTFVDDHYDKQYPTKTFHGASVVAYHMSGLEVTTPLPLNEKYYLQVALLLEDYQKLKVEEMWCTDGMEDPGDNIVEVFKDGCSNADSANFMWSYPYRKNARKWRAALYPAYWEGSPPQMQCFFTIRMCLSTDESPCEEDTCAKRKRRQADTSRTETIDAVVTFQTSSSVPTDNTTAKPCIEEKVTALQECTIVSQGVFPAFATLGVLALVLLILSTCLLLALCCGRRRQKDKKKTYSRHASGDRGVTNRRTPSLVYTHEGPY